MSTIHILGIRHHGPGSAKNVKAFLEETKPDIVLVEGPPEGNDLLQWVVHEEIKPPVAILAYMPDNPKRAVFYPFAEFSPEWQAIHYGVSKNIPVRFIDLPLANSFALEEEKEKQKNPQSVNNNAFKNSETEIGEGETEILQHDPMRYLAEAAGFTDGEKWWEYMFEQRISNEQVFDAVSEAMQSLRESFPEKENRNEKLREAHMRKMIRQAEKEMFNTIVVICGAWHAPALANMPKQKDDNELLKNLPKVKVETTWIPWTYHRLTFWSGYGAGIQSPGWYDHVWTHTKDVEVQWMSKVAQLFRSKDMDTSVAHVIEAVRLSEALASLRNFSRPGLDELNEATLSVLCNGESILMHLIREELIVSDKIGAVPEEIPKPPLQIDLEKLQRRLRLPAEASFKDYTLDLRKESDLERSQLLHRLLLLEIHWGVKTFVAGKGTFKEQWRLQWEPEFSIQIIEKGAWGNSIEEAATNFVIHIANESSSLKQISELLQNSIPAEIPKAIEVLMKQLDNLAATTSDVIQLMEVLPELVSASRYGNVRQTDADLMLQLVNSMITRICISLPAACSNVDEDAANKLLDLFFKLNDAIAVLQQADQINEWQQTLMVIAENKNAAPAVSGYSTRLLSDFKILTGESLAKKFSFALSTASQPEIAAAWLEGFLKGSGTILLLDHDLWNLVNNWVLQLQEGTFVQLLPIMRRTFAQFTNAERRKLGEKVKSGESSSITARFKETNFNHERAENAIPIVLKLLGINSEYQ
ncbi:MAG TPA: DUF5682 family protein [Chitinophagales bacterium]|nr:DUF5682 family protein [Chitinophagales bacterium]